MVWSTGQGNYTRVCADGTSPRISFALPPFGTCLYIALFCSQDDSHNLHVSEAGLRLSETPAVRRVIEKHMPFMLEVVAESRSSSTCGHCPRRVLTAAVCRLSRDKWVAGLQILCGLENTVEWPVQYGAWATFTAAPAAHPARNPDSQKRFRGV